MQFISPTKGPMDFDAMFAEIIAYVREVPEATYRVIVGTDSQLREETSFVTAVIVHRVGKGARYFYSREREVFGRSLRQRIFYEAARSLDVAGQLAARLAANGHADFDIEIHLDIGRHGETKNLIREVVGMVTGSGFDARIKPDSFGASKVADKYTK
ncbi:MAG: ribonuclease H-like YkuK family protein [Limnochordaceae bacterium]|uniref:Ribonuclease H-like YkuK family protein n=1 Tax=Carboxydichorda subterranea TaxID=3109565 RepID=A0ABZ1BW89_9FIRM|nr:ribonuclease H-like YkuK family protein [Limnochorda sp. L945t]MBE3599590.1 ribonuclease H-like YkuK family protein [Limnochordaceae bacterium]WRP17066.1 ribonuclease H-like YkuK family protein [Limnochorda sp. L945t]